MRVDIISKREGPRLEDVRAKRLLSENAGTIRRLADQISNGGFTRMRQEQARQKEEPKPEGLLIYSMAGSAKPVEPEPYIRVSLNGRIVLADRISGKQLQLLGEIRNRFRSKVFVLATEENGFLSPVNEEIRQALSQFDNAEINPALSELDIAQKFGESLGLVDAQHSQQCASGGQSEKGQSLPQDDSSELL